MQHPHSHLSPAVTSGMNPRLGCLAQESLALRNSLLEKLVAMGTAQVTRLACVGVCKVVPARLSAPVCSCEWDALA